jgi:metal-responsive CopG/Arc/MetJ family transcriptional regulator
MSTEKVAITLKAETLAELDRLVAERAFPSRSRAIQVAVQEKIQRLSRTRLARQCAKLDPMSEKALSEEGIMEDAAEWPEY